jgi:GntR family transcriptional repressor for pyruvate dehydrogenase complex
MGVSRPVLREALKALEVMNIITIRQGLGAFVRDIRADDIIEHLDIVFHPEPGLYRDLYAARRIIESGAARIAAGAIGGEELAALAQNIREAEAAVDDSGVYAAKDIELHGLIMQAAGNRILPVFMTSIDRLALAVRHTSNSHRSIRLQTIADHRAILAAMEAHDGEAAAQAMSAHIGNVERLFFELQT